MFTVFVFHIVLTYTRQEGLSGNDGNTVKDLLLNTVSQKDEKPHTVVRESVQKSINRKTTAEFFCKLISIFLLFWGMVIYANQF